MKLKFLGLVILLIVFACKEEKKSPVESVDYTQEELDITTSIYPENITKVFDAHGGLQTWSKMKSLEFTMPKPEGDEITITDLKNRKSLIKMPKHSIGYNGNDVWLQSIDTTSYKGKPKFYYNLMFYFYAMPFVLADDGINYQEAQPLDFEGISYPGIKVSYENGVGASPEDEYIIYYHPETHKMTWLAYTVTYFTKEKAKEFHFIKYSDWQTVNGVVLPKQLDWYNYENNLPTTKRDEVKFTNVILTEDAPNPSIFEIPEGAKIVE